MQGDKGPSVALSHPKPEDSFATTEPLASKVQSCEALEGESSSLTSGPVSLVQLTQGASSFWASVYSSVEWVGMGVRQVSPLQPHCPSSCSLNSALGPTYGALPWLFLPDTPLVLFPLTHHLSQKTPPLPSVPCHTALLCFLVTQVTLCSEALGVLVGFRDSGVKLLGFKSQSPPLRAR